jgi:hypothetical protein
VNNINLVKEALDDLRKNHIEVILGGGWAEELLEIIPPKVHSDIDLFYISNSFSLLEEYISSKGLERRRSREGVHKRAYKYNDGTTIEVIIIEKEGKGYFTDYGSGKILRWPSPLTQITEDGIECLSCKSLCYRRAMQKYLRS